VKKEALGRMLITKPDGSAVQRDVRITYEDQGGGLFEVEVLGDSPIQGYKFAVLQAELKKTRDLGKVVS
jgi:hypothetical protein